MKMLTFTDQVLNQYRSRRIQYRLGNGFLALESTVRLCSVLHIRRTICFRLSLCRANKFVERTRVVREMVQISWQSYAFISVLGSAVVPTIDDKPNRTYGGYIEA